MFAIVVFATITAEGYINPPGQPQVACVFNRNDGACHYGVGIGVIGFLACVAFLMSDVYLPMMSNAQERKRMVLADLVFSGKYKRRSHSCVVSATRIYADLLQGWRLETVSLPVKA